MQCWQARIGWLVEGKVAGERGCSAHARLTKSSATPRHNVKEVFDTATRIGMGEISAEDATQYRTKHERRGAA